MPRLHSPRRTNVIVLGRLVQLDEPEAAGRFSGELSQPEAEHMAADIAAGLHEGFEVDGLGDRAVSVEAALEGTKSKTEKRRTPGGTQEEQ